MKESDSLTLPADVGGRSVLRTPALGVHKAGPVNLSPIEINKPMSIGVTGTRGIVSSAQAKMMDNLVSSLGPGGVEVHHGDCIGVDLAFHKSAVTMKGWSIVIHPPLIPRYRAYCDLLHSHNRMAYIAVLDAESYLERNHMIVDNSEVLFAYPKEDTVDPDKHMRSGTWATVRYALADGLSVVLGLPTGAMWELRPNPRGAAVRTYIGEIE